MLKCKVKTHLNVYSTRYEDVLLLEDFNVDREEGHVGTFSELYNLRCTMKKQACFQNPINPINLVLANIPPSFQNSSVIETGLLDFHQITVTVMRIRFKRLQLISTTETTKI